MNLHVQSAWAALDRHAAALASTTLRQLFSADPQRFATFSTQLDDLMLDYSKCCIDADVRRLLAGLVDAAGVAALRDAMFRGERINSTERRSVLHVALRMPADRALVVEGRDVMPEVMAERRRVAAFAAGVRDDSTFSDVVNIGIGGSDLGAAMATAALKPYHSGPRVHFVSNVDGAHLADTLAALDARRTLVIVASKTFTTTETMTNAHSALGWSQRANGAEAARTHFVAVSTALDKVAAFGIPADRVFGFWDWVGGRYSVWSAVGLPLMLAIGPARFDEMLAGAHAMDEHFLAAPFEQNLPMLLGALGVWHRAVKGHASRAVIPYEHRLGRFPAHIQQLEMESNGKSVSLDGAAVARATGAVVWGTPGTDAQHSYFQLLHQGTDAIPCEFLVAAEGHEHDMAHHHRILLANCLAQAEALAMGRTQAEAEQAMIGQGVAPAVARELAPHKTFPGNRPSITIAYRRLDPFTLGRLVALYEHRVMVEAAIHGINAFDQWGVELGKELATSLLPAVSGGAVPAGCSSSTSGLAAHLTSLLPRARG